QHARLHSAAAATGQEDRQVIVIMTIAIADAAADHHHAVVEQRAFAFLGVLELLNEAGDLRHVEAIDFADGVNLVLVVAVVRHSVMAVGHTGFGIGAIGAIAG